MPYLSCQQRSPVFTHSLDAMQSYQPRHGPASLQQYTAHYLAHTQSNPHDVFLGLDNLSFASRAVWDRYSPTSEGLRIVRDRADHRMLSFTLIGDISYESFNLHPGDGYGENGSTLLDLTSTFRVERPRHCAYSHLWDRTLLNITYLKEAAIFNEDAPMLSANNGTITLCHRFVNATDPNALEGKEDPSLRTVVRSERAPDILKYYDPDHWGLSSADALDQLLECSVNPAYIVRLLPAFICGENRRLLQPRQYPLLRGSLVQVTFTVRDVAMDDLGTPDSRNAFVAVVRNIDVLLPAQYNEYTSELWNGSGLSWS
ncbi:hypothetical protein PENSPDRAFT_327097 [Peniophora sp. CONT]|nr:hypothetical protein PENSPDRAFT_327097 [Peniophora sp. CONT]